MKLLLVIMRRTASRRDVRDALNCSEYCILSAEQAVVAIDSRSVVGYHLFGTFSDTASAAAEGAVQKAAVTHLEDRLRSIVLAYCLQAAPRSSAIRVVAAVYQIAPASSCSPADLLVRAPALLYVQVLAPCSTPSRLSVLLARSSCRRLCLPPSRRSNCATRDSTATHLHSQLRQG
ncbi:hypothetical protein BV20DRAFT_295406 [Pilatotrama ljubarskyi]|nr:hypothetical protein BV20DRAFT_295406 [Pilatotrama ljubarskyi]